MSALENNMFNSWHTSLRRAWMADTLWELQKDGIIKAWSWAPNENEFFEPMTKPALSPDQRVWLLAEYLMYFELIQAEPKKTYKQICSEYFQGTSLDSAQVAA